MADRGRGQSRGRGGRGGGRGGFNPAFGKKAGTPLENSYRFLIPSSTASKAIGKGGANIKEVKEAIKEMDADAKITIYTVTGNGQPVEEGAADRVLTIQSTTQCLGEVLKMMQPKIQDPSLEGKKPELRMLVPTHCASSIIGKGGSIVKQMKEETGSYIQVHRDSLPNSEETVVKVQNLELDKLVETVMKVIEAIKENKSKQPICYYDPVWFQPGSFGETGSFMETMASTNHGQMAYGGYGEDAQWGYAAGGYGSTGYDNGYYDQSYGQAQGWGYEAKPAPRGRGGARGRARGGRGRGRGF